MANSNRRKSFLYLIILILGGIGLYVLFNTSDDNTHFADAREIAVKDVENVDRISLVSADGDSVLLNKEAGYWKVNDQFIAREDRIKHLLNTIQNIEVRTPVPSSQEEAVKKQLDKSHVSVKIYADDKLLQSYLVGPPTPDQQGTYLINTIEEVYKNKAFITYLLGFKGYLTSRFDARIGFWRDNTLIYYPELRIQRLELMKEGDIIEITFDGEHYISNVSIDEKIIRRYLLNFKKLPVEYYTQTPSEQERSKLPFFQLNIASLEGTPQVIEGYRKAAPEGMLDINGNPAKWDKDRFYIKSNKEWSVAQYFVFDPILTGL